MDIHTSVTSHDISYQVISMIMVVTVQAKRCRRRGVRNQYPTPGVTVRHSSDGSSRMNRQTPRDGLQEGENSTTSEYHLQADEVPHPGESSYQETAKPNFKVDPGGGVETHHIHDTTLTARSWGFTCSRCRSQSETLRPALT